jgi:hypothetical protein
MAFRNLTQCSLVDTERQGIPKKTGSLVLRFCLFTQLLSASAVRIFKVMSDDSYSDNLQKLRAKCIIVNLYLYEHDCI